MFSCSLVVYVGIGTYCSLFSDGMARGMVEYRALLPLETFNLFIDCDDIEFFFKESCFDFFCTFPSKLMK